MPAVKDKTFHYTNEELVKTLISLIPFKVADSVLDAGSGKNKVWYNNLPEKLKLFKCECEIDDGCDFFLWNQKVDWVIGNPPFHIGWAFTEKAIDLANKGVAFLLNINGLNSNTLPSRLEKIAQKGFEITHIRVVSDRRWFGRYYFMILEKNKKGFFSWDTKNY